MSDALEARLRQGKALMASDVSELYTRHIESSELQSLRQLQAGLGDLLRKLGDIATQSGKVRCTSSAKKR